MVQSYLLVDIRERKNICFSLVSDEWDVICASSMSENYYLNLDNETLKILVIKSTKCWCLDDLVVKAPKIISIKLSITKKLKLRSSIAQSHDLIVGTIKRWN